MLPLTGLSRRAFVVASALAATAPTAVAARRRKPNPEAFLASAIQGPPSPTARSCGATRRRSTTRPPAGAFAGDLVFPAAR